MSKTNADFKFNREEKKIVTLAALGGMLEFYDFIIYGIFSVYFASQFFPSDNALISVIQSYVVFILGYIARPLGGILFSHMGDEYGRKKALVITVLLMGAASLGIGLLPTYDQIGLFAPVALLILRLLQGLALGGELPSTYVYISESMPKKQGSGFGITMTGVNSGLLLGIGINYLLTKIFSKDALMAYGWRLPFILGGMLCLVSFVIRKTLHETKIFKKEYAEHDIPEFPLLYLFQNYTPQLLVGIMLTSIMSGLVLVAIIFMPTYLHEIVKLDHEVISYNMLFVVLLNVISIFLTGKLANRIKPKTILWSLLGLTVFFTPISFYWIAKQSMLLAALIVLGVLEGVAALLIPLLLTCLFPAKIRLTGVALSYNLGFTLFGGVAPIIISAFINSGYNAYLTPVFFLFFVVFICGLGLFYASKRDFFLMPGSNKDYHPEKI
jgi:MFS family permease